MATIRSSHLYRWIFSLPPMEYLVRQLRELLIGSLQHGPIPKHIAFVMDGNRRFARKNSLETVEGHHIGFEALAKILEVCYKSGVQVVTVFAFSIENFKRSKYEVDGLMDMAKTKLVQMSGHGELFDRYGASVRILGDRSLLREDVLRQIERAVDMTRHNDRAVLNVCFPYTGREEITRSVRETVREYSVPPAKPHSMKRPFSESHIQRNILSRSLSPVSEEVHMKDTFTLNGENGPTSSQLSFSSSTNSDAESLETSEHELESSSSTSFRPASSHTSYSTSPVLKPTSAPISNNSRLPDPESITAATLTKNTYTYDAPPLDLLVRTSGVNRLSDFMLWQCHENTEIAFLDCLWPEFDLWSFLPVLMEWQWRQRRVAGESTNLKV